MRGRVIAYFLFTNGGRPPSLIYISSQFLWKIQICAYIFVVLQNFVKIGLSAAELLRIYDFQNGGRPPSWILYDVIADHSRLVLDGLSILLKLQCHRINILRNIAIFYLARLAWNCLLTPILGEFLRDMTGFPLELGIGAKGLKTRVLEGRKTFKIGLAVLTQYRRVADWRTDRQTAIFP